MKDFLDDLQRRELARIDREVRLAVELAPLLDELLDCQAAVALVLLVENGSLALAGRALEDCLPAGRR